MITIDGTISKRTKVGLVAGSALLVASSGYFEAVHLRQDHLNAIRQGTEIALRLEVRDFKEVTKPQAGKSWSECYNADKFPIKYPAPDGRYFFKCDPNLKTFMDDQEEIEKIERKNRSKQ